MSHEPPILRCGCCPLANSIVCYPRAADDAAEMSSSGAKLITSRTCLVFQRTRRRRTRTKTAAWLRHCKNICIHNTPSTSVSRDFYPGRHVKLTKSRATMRATLRTASHHPNMEGVTVDMYMYMSSPT